MIKILLGEIDRNKKPIKAQYFLAKPNRDVISKLNEAYNDNLSIKLNAVNELTFSLPVYIDVHHQRKRNPNIDLIREKYLIKEVKNKKIEWYTVQSIENGMSESGDVKNITCNAYYHSLTDKLFTAYKQESYSCRQVLKDILAPTLWTIDYIDADFDLTYRTFEFNSTNVLEAIYSVAETYNAIVLFDTDKRTVNFQKPELTGLNKGLTFSHGKYMKSMNQNYQTDQIVTRLTPTGSDGLGIQKVNPTGQNYIEDYSYWMYPFKRDSNKKVLSSSFWMSDSLCHALLDYSELVESKTGLFKGYLEQQEKYENQLIPLKVDLDRLQKNEAVITDTMLSLQFDGKMFFEKYQHTGFSSKDFVINKIYAYAVLIKIDNGSGITVNVNGQQRSFNSGQWSLLDKVNGIESLQVSINGGSTGVFIQVTMINLDEFNSTSMDNATTIVERYNLDNKQNQINLKQLEIEQINQKLTDTKALISALQNELLPEKNFSVGQLRELNEFMYEKEFNDDVYIDPHDLYKAALDKFKELQKPQLTIEVDIVNFLEIVEEQRNWDKLTLGDFVNIKYEPFGTYVEARITEINFDYEKSSVKLTLSNAKDRNDETKRIEKFIGDAKNTSVTVDINKTKWGKAVVDTSEMSQLFENFWNKVTNDINMASNEYVTIDRKGITIIDPNDPLRFLRATHGVLGLTRSGGLKYETAISPDGVIAEMVLGKIILGQRVVIGDTTGVFTIEGSRLMIDDRCGREVVKLGLLSEHPDKFGFYLNRYASTNCNDNTVVNRVKMTADEGFIIERIRNGVTDKTFGTSLDGDLFVKAGVDDQVFTIDKNGLALGSSVWSAAPFHADYFGNVWMNKLFADSAEIKNSLFKDGHIRGSDLELRDKIGGMIKMYPEWGLWFGAESFADAIASIAMDGTAKFKKLIVTNGKNELLMDSNKGLIDFSQFDAIFGYINAENIKTDIITAALGIVNDLTVSRLVTKDVINPYGSVINFIKVEGNRHQWITAEASEGTRQASTLDGRLLYYEHGTTDRLTVQAQDKKGNTNTPVMVPNYNERVKMDLRVLGSGAEAYPVIQMGQGSSLSDDRGKAYIKKPNDLWSLIYTSADYNKERRLIFRNDKLEISTETGDIEIKHDNGTKIVVKNNGEINMVATGKISVSGTSYEFA